MTAQSGSSAPTPSGTPSTDEAGHPPQLLAPATEWGVLLLLTAVMLIASVWWAGRAAERATVDTLRRDAAAVATARAGALQAELDKQRTLPLVLAEDPEIRALLAGPADPALTERINRKLQALAAGSRAAVIYLIDRTGMTLAASNWQEPTSFVGFNYAFRAYFSDAALIGASEQFALGTVSNRPGFYLSRRVGPSGAVLGVVVVKVEFEAIEQSWARTPTRSFVADGQGVVLITDVPGWRFRTTRELEETTRTLVADAFQVRPSALEPLPLARRDRREPDLVRAQIDAQMPAMPALHVAIGVPTTAWEMHLLAPTNPSLPRAVNQERLLAGFATLSASLVGAVLMMRRHRTARRIAEERHLRRRLEEEVERRTRDLSVTNGLLRAEMEERRRAETALRQRGDELVQATKLATLGQIAASVAHEINQPLAAIRSYADNGMVLLQRGQTEATDRNLGLIGGLTDRMGRITAELKRFARKASGTVEPVDLDGAIASALALLDHRIRRDGVSVERHLGPTGVHVLGEAVRLEQVIVNLVQNALDAMEGREERRLTLAVAADDDGVTLTVTDTGPGLDPGQIEALFMPFHTTKPEGLGLGLAISSDIVSDFGGSLSAGPAPGGGARFTVRLRPATAGEAA